MEKLVDSRLRLNELGKLSLKSLGLLDLPEVVHSIQQATVGQENPVTGLESRLPVSDRTQSQLPMAHDHQ